MYPGDLLITCRLSSESRLRLTLRCLIHFVNMNTCVRCSIWMVSLASRFIPSLSLCFMSVFTTLPFKSNSQVPTFVGVIRGSSKSAQEAAGNWSRWNPELSRSRGISSGRQTPMRFSTMRDFPALVYPSRTMEFIFMYLIVLIHSFQPRNSMRSMPFTRMRYLSHWMLELNPSNVSSSGTCKGRYPPIPGRSPHPFRVSSG